MNNQTSRALLALAEAVSEMERIIGKELNMRDEDLNLMHEKLDTALSEVRKLWEEEKP